MHTPVVATLNGAPVPGAGSHESDALAFLRGIMSGSCVTPAADCGVRRVLSRRRNSSQLGDQPKGGTRDIIVYYCPDSVGRA